MWSSSHIHILSFWPFHIPPCPSWFFMLTLIIPSHSLSGVSDPVGVSLAGWGQFLLPRWGLASGDPAIWGGYQRCPLRPGWGSRHSPRATWELVHQQGGCLLPDGEKRRGCVTCRCLCRVHSREWMSVLLFKGQKRFKMRSDNTCRDFITTLILHVFFSNSCFFLSQREYERGVQDCDSALCVSESSRRALYRKAICLRELGRLREAYECGTKCLLTAPHVCQHWKYWCQDLSAVI